MNILPVGVELLHANRWTGGVLNEANSRFSQFYEKRLKTNICYFYFSMKFLLQAAGIVQGVRHCSIDIQQ